MSSVCPQEEEAGRRQTSAFTPGFPCQKKRGQGLWKAVHAEVWVLTVGLGAHLLDRSGGGGGACCHRGAFKKKTSEYVGMGLGTWKQSHMVSLV